MRMCLPVQAAKSGILAVCVRCICVLLSLMGFHVDWLSLITAPEAILEASGGALTDIFGNHYQYGEDVSLPNKLGVIATAKNVDHKAIIDKIPNDLKQKLSG